MTGGQPFLVQLLGDGLVQRFNRQLRQQLDPPSPTFTATDVDAVVDEPQFYQQGDAYFRGIWSQADEAPPSGGTMLSSARRSTAAIALSCCAAGSPLARSRRPFRGPWCEAWGSDLQQAEI